MVDVILKGKFEFLTLRKALWQVLRMYDVGGKLLNGIKNMYVTLCKSKRGGESKCFRIEGGVGQGCIMFPWLLNEYMEKVIKEIKLEM